MTVHRFQPMSYHNTLGAHEPVLQIADGDTVVTTTVDAYGNDEHERPVASRGNPQTGPFYIDGAEPGDTLVMHLDRLSPNRQFGYSTASLADNVVDPPYVRELPARDTVKWQIDRQRNTATVVEPLTRLGAFQRPLAPMLGCFGVCPSGGQAISTSTAGTHGGNMDYRGFQSGVTVYFPVFVPGALLFVGDGHGVQGDGEISGNGIEISFDVQFTVSIRKARETGWPRGESIDYIFTVGNARPLDQALQHATTEMMRWLRGDYGLDAAGASILMSQCIEYEVGNVFDPAYTIVCKLAKRYLPG